MDHEAAQIRRDIEQTRAAMSAKVTMIQERLDDTVRETASSLVGTINAVLERVQQVQNMLEQVTSTVDRTIRRVEDTTQQTTTSGRPAIELITEVYRRPWMLLGAAMVVGYILGAGDRTSSAIMPATPEPACGPNLDSFKTDSPTGNLFISPPTPVTGSRSTLSTTPRTEPTTAS